MKKTIVAILIISNCAFIAQAQNSLKLASWNIEHLAENNDEGCVPRNNSDYAKLRDFARTIEADVVALQEVESAKAVARVFPEEKWHIIVSDRPASESYACYRSGKKSTQQRVAVVIRKGIEYTDAGTFKELGLDNAGLRYGIMVKLFAGSDTLDIMAVHLKSGCFVDDYSLRETKACEIFKRQVPVLDSWVESRIKKNRAFVVLGDFNHRIANPENKLWQVLTEMDSESVVIKNSMENLKGCHPKYPAPIDHIILGGGAEKFYVNESEAVYYYTETPESMTREDMLSDHCPISVVLDFKERVTRQ